MAEIRTERHAELYPQPDGPQARARGQVTFRAFDDGRRTFEVDVRQLALVDGSRVVVDVDGAPVAQLEVAAGAGKVSVDDAGRDLPSELPAGAQVAVRDTDAAAVGEGGSLAVDRSGLPLLQGTVRDG